jgi:hypothetical protein
MWLLALAGLLAQALSSDRHGSEDRQRSRGRIIYYRTCDGRADYGFSIERQPNGSYRPYIISQPSYCSRATGAHETHRLTSAGGRVFVCWDRALQSEEAAKKVAARWADNTQRYIQTGQRF